jgi:hypothetical protein
MKKKDYIKLWCSLALIRTKKVNQFANSSYGLKHKCEDSIGVYVSNEEMKEVMNELGFQSKCDGINCYYNISKVVNRVIFKEKIGQIYDDSIRGYDSKAKNITIEIK